ncbi:MAG: RNA polymerase factor sigma-54 [Thermoanaerobaculia bacterium]
MALEQKLSLRLQQKLVMTPSLQQAIKLLQMTRMELVGEIAQELEENPILEEGDDTFEEGSEEAPTEEASSEDKEHEEAMEEIDLEAYFNDYLEGSTGPKTFEPREAPPIENTLSTEDDLYDHLLWQVHMSDISERLRGLAELVIGNLDPDGFLTASDEEILDLAERGREDDVEPFTLEEVRQAVALVRGLDPPGVAGRDLRESLEEQLRRLGEEEDSLAMRMVRDDWEAALKRQFPSLAKKYGVPLAELEPVVETIRGLETRPGRLYGAERTHYVTPDVYVKKVGNDWVIQLNDDGLPRLRISKAYRRMLRKMKAEGKEGEAQQYIKEKLRSAVWLIKSLDQRQRTIYKVAESIVRQQRAFLENGIEYLRPMVLRDVAEDIGMHESTVSRVVSNKYIHTPRGLCPMKFFFHSGIDREYGEDISSLTVKRKIEHLIEAENPDKPLSDSALAKALKREGINIARRTVAKYRDELSIPSSTHRKQIF